MPSEVGISVKLFAKKCEKLQDRNFRRWPKMAIFSGRWWPVSRLEKSSLKLSYKDLVLDYPCFIDSVFLLTVESLSIKSKFMKLKKCVLSYIDILGFANQVRAIDSKAKLKKAQERVKSFVSNLGADEDAKISVTSFSDCVIRTVSIEKNDSVKDVFLSEVTRLCNVQLWCAQDGIVVRGGLTIGNHFSGMLKAKGTRKFQSVISPALVEAYTLESQHAIFPRIITTKEIVQKLNLNPGHCVLRDQKTDLYFLDYLMHCYYENGTLDHFQIDAHKKLIQEGLLSNSPSIQKKYRWLKKYHNNSLERMLEWQWNDDSNSEEWKGKSFEVYFKHHRGFMSFIRSKN